MKKSFRAETETKVAWSFQLKLYETYGKLGYLKLKEIFVFHFFCFF